MPISSMQLTQKVKAGEMSKADAIAKLIALKATDTRSYKRIKRFVPPK